MFKNILVIATLFAAAAATQTLDVFNIKNFLKASTPLNLMKSAYK